MKIGMIGIQSRHLDFFSQQINIERRFPDVEVIGVWGEDERERLPEIAQVLRIPYICDTLDELLSLCDTVFVLPRNGFTHMKYARIAQACGKGLFVDKPFAVCPEDANELIAYAEKNHLPLTGGSTLCYLPEIPNITKWANTSPLTVISYSADPESPFGGWTYYGSHLCDLCAQICGIDASSVFACQEGKSVTAIVSYKNKQAILHSDPKRKYPEVIVADSTYIVQTLDDNSCFRYGLGQFINELKTNNVQSHLRLRFSSLLLDACLRSIKSGELVIL